MTEFTRQMKDLVGKVVWMRRFAISGLVYIKSYTGWNGVDGDLKLISNNKDFSDQYNVGQRQFDGNILAFHPIPKEEELRFRIIMGI